MSSYLGLPASFDAFLEFILDLRQGAGVPHALPGLGVDGAQIDRIAAMAPQDPTAGGNPVPLDERGARAIFVKALDGSL